MAIPYECPYCHASLDFGERCDCQDGPDEIDKKFKQDYEDYKKRKLDEAIAATPEWMQKLCKG